MSYEIINKVDTWHYREKYKVKDYLSVDEEEVTNFILYSSCYVYEEMKHLEFNILLKKYTEIY